MAADALELVPVQKSERLLLPLVNAGKAELRAADLKDFGHVRMK